MSSAASATATPPVAETRQGRLRGVEVDGVQTFLGIPYAAPPERFRPPGPAASWTGVRDATRYGASCPQVRRGDPNRPPPIWVDDPDAAMDEDCLFLNVWTPSAPVQRPLPVLVWVHTGGFGSGSGSAPLFAGDNLARSGEVVMVSFNHRLGALGFLHLEHLDPGFAGSANLGMLDMVSALEWIRDNIAAFGGDPGNVTVFGESGGGLKICTLMGMPAAAGLFYRAIVQSGGRISHLDPEHSRACGRMVLEHLEIPQSDVSRIRTVPVAALVAAQAHVGKALAGRGPGFPHPFTPTVDGEVVPFDPFDPDNPAWSNRIPLLIGYNRTEATYFSRMGYGDNDPALTRAGAIERLRPVLRDAAEPVYAAFEAEHPQLSPYELYIVAFTDFPSGAYTQEIAARRVRAGGAPTFAYRFDWSGSTWRGIPGAPHMIELPFVFDAVGRAAFMVGEDPATVALAGRVSTAWRAFARAGNPSTPDLPDWPAYDPADPWLYSIDTESGRRRDMAPGPRRAVRRGLGLEA